MRVIIIDDDQELAGLLKQTLQMAFYEKAKSLAKDHHPITESLEVELFNNQKAALSHIQDYNNFIDLVFIEPATPGFQDCTYLHISREKFRNKYGEIIVVSNDGQRSIVKEALLCGAYDFLLKPFGPEEIKEYVFKAWNHRYETE